MKLMSSRFRLRREPDPAQAAACGFASPRAPMFPFSLQACFASKTLPWFHRRAGLLMKLMSRRFRLRRNTDPGQAAACGFASPRAPMSPFSFQACFVCKTLPWLHRRAGLLMKLMSRRFRLRRKTDPAQAEDCDSPFTKQFFLSARLGVEN